MGEHCNPGELTVTVESYAESCGWVLASLTSVYSRSKPLTIEEFDQEKKWWGGAERRGRKTNQYAWKVSAADIVEKNYNLDAVGKSPHREEVQNGDPVELMAEYQRIVSDLKKAQAALKDELMAALTAGNGGR